MSEQTSNGPITEASDMRAMRKPADSVRRLIIVAVIAVGLVLAIFGAGLAAFTGYVLLASEEQPQAADAIVVVTGGSGRLDKAISLLEQGLGRKLLISGVYAGYSENTLSARYNLSAAQIECCVELDRKALNTVANATQTALWAKTNKFKSLIIVTSAYHMPRTMLEMRRAASDIEFQSHLVTKSADRSMLARLFDWNNMQLLTKEYGKLLAAILHGTTERLDPRKAN